MGFQDKSWRVRYMVANQLYELCEAVGPEPTRCLMRAFFCICHVVANWSLILAQFVHIVLLLELQCFCYFKIRRNLPWSNLCAFTCILTLLEDTCLNIRLIIFFLHEYSGLCRDENITGFLWGTEKGQLVESLIGMNGVVTCLWFSLRVLRIWWNIITWLLLWDTNPRKCFS